MERLPRSLGMVPESVRTCLRMTWVAPAQAQEPQDMSSLIDGLVFCWCMELNPPPLPTRHLSPHTRSRPSGVGPGSVWRDQLWRRRPHSPRCG
jgi:hypothetical protein